MKQEDKDLLLKDLCARLPYNPLISIDGNRYRLEEIRNALIGINMYKITFDGCDIEAMDIRPYLVPISNMTEVQRNEYESLCIKETTECADLSGFFFTKDNYYDTVESFDWLNKNHFDYRGLIKKGLAIDCTNLNIY